MKMNLQKTMVLAVLFVGALLCSVGYGESRYSTGIGRDAPPLALVLDGDTTSLGAFRGKFVALTLWSATNAVSRRDVNLYTAWERRHPGAPFEAIGVNLDDSESLYRQIVRSDGLDPDMQYRPDVAEAHRIQNDLGMSGRLGSLLIGPDGRIVAHNPDAEALDAIILGQRHSTR